MPDLRFADGLEMHAQSELLFAVQALDARQHDALLLKVAIGGLK